MRADTHDGPEHNALQSEAGYIDGAPVKTGKEEVVKVHCDEGVATHIGPEPCADIREDTGEASVGERIGQPSSREKYFSPSADVLINAEGNTERCDIASARPTRRGRRPWHVPKLFGREPGGLGFDLRRGFRRPAPGRRGVVAGD